jgi:hypothetical protein
VTVVCALASTNPANTKAHANTDHFAGIVAPPSLSRYVGGIGRLS